MYMVERHARQLLALACGKAVATIVLDYCTICPLQFGVRVQKVDGDIGK
jgi:hypothetical protein